MALYKEFTNRDGIKLTYWKVINMNKNIIQKYADITFGGYIDNTDCTSHMNPKKYQRTRVLWDKYDEYFGVDAVTGVAKNDLVSAYNYAKAHDSFFKGSKDI